MKPLRFALVGLAAVLAIPATVTAGAAFAVWLFETPARRRVPPWILP